jgi:ribosomal small subunit protein bTHX
VILKRFNQYFQIAVWFNPAASGKENLNMGKGDRRSKRGKIARGTSGTRRPKKKKKKEKK